jgi:hypothetical protein
MARWYHTAAPGILTAHREQAASISHQPPASQQQLRPHHHQDDHPALQPDANTVFALDFFHEAMMMMMMMMERSRRSIILPTTHTPAECDLADVPRGDNAHWQPGKAIIIPTGQKWAIWRNAST